LCVKLVNYYDYLPYVTLVLTYLKFYCANIETCSVHVKALNNYIEFKLCHTEHTNFVIAVQTQELSTPAVVHFLSSRPGKIIKERKLLSISTFIRII